MTRSLQTDPRAIRAERRTEAPTRRRSAELPSLRRAARLLRAAGIETDAQEPPPSGRRATVRVRVTPARSGFHHPIGRPEIRELLDFFGPITTYGLRSIELRQRDGEATAPVQLGELLVPGVVVLYEQPAPPWALRGVLAPDAATRLEQSGAEISSSGATTRVAWPDESLADCMRFDGLLHEIGHHLTQHHAGKRTARVMRTADHERRAQRFADACRAAWAARDREA